MPVYFGYLKALKEDVGVEQAVEAPLAVVDATAGLDAPQWFEVRVGIASGLLVGDLIGADAAQQDGVVCSAEAKPAAPDAATAR